MDNPNALEGHFFFCNSHLSEQVKIYLIFFFLSLFFFVCFSFCFVLVGWVVVLLWGFIVWFGFGFICLFLLFVCFDWGFWGGFF